MAFMVNNALVAPGLTLIDASSNVYTLVGKANTSGGYNYLFVNSSNYVVFSDPGIAGAMLNLNEVMQICQTANLANNNNV